MKQNDPRRKVAARPDDSAQSRAFIEKAREIGADHDNSAADSLIGRLAKMKPSPREKLVIGASDVPSEIPDELRTVMAQNSEALNDITKKVRD